MSVGPIICDSSPLIGLDQIGQLSILNALFGTIIIPSAVAREVAPSVAVPVWIEQKVLVQSIGSLILKASLGQGESETISLALELSARLVIVDDRPARRLAQSLNLSLLERLVSSWQPGRRDLFRQ